MTETTNIANSVLIQGCTLQDIERMINRAVDARMAAFYETIKEKPPVMVPRIEVAKRLGISLPTLDAYGKHNILHPRHLGGRIYYNETEIISFSKTK